MSTFQKLRKEERETRKNLIVDAAMDLFSQKDFHKIGMNNRLVTHAIYASVTGVVMSFKNYPGRSPEEIKRHIHRLVRIISSVFTTGIIPDSLREIARPDTSSPER